MNTKFKVIGLTRLGIKPESTAPEAYSYHSAIQAVAVKYETKCMNGGENCK